MTVKSENAMPVEQSMIYAKIIADSKSEGGVRLTTMELSYPRFIHGEVMTHRVFSRNAMSSRAIPVAKMIAQVRNDPVIPIHWGLNQPGMQAHAEVADTELAEHLWCCAAQAAATYAESLSAIGLHKQVANRILEPFQWMRTIITATEWDNFFALRIHPDAEPHINALAIAMKDAMGASSPVLREWHLPYILDSEREVTNPEKLCEISSARCARVSYLTHDGVAPSIEADLALYERLAGGRPMHASPLEHQARSTEAYVRSGNLRGWVQFRKTVEAAQWGAA